MQLLVQRSANTTCAPIQPHKLFLWSGAEGIALSNTWGLSDAELQDPDTIWDKFAESQPQENFRIHRLEFQKLSQNDDESVDDFVTRCKAKVVKCKFATQVIRDDRLVEQIIAGIKYTEVQRKLLQKDDTLTLKQAYDICRTHEASVTHMQKMSTLQSHTNVDAVSRNHKFGPKPCGNCGTKHAPRQCPAYHSTCDACGKMSHWQKYCRSKTQTNRNMHNSQRGRGYQRNQNARPTRRNRSHTPRRHHDVVTSYDSDTDTELNDNIDNLNFESIQFSSIDGDERTEVFTHLEIKHKGQSATLKVKVDTGAQGNSLPLRIFRRMHPELLDSSGYPKKGSTTPKHTVLIAYNGSVIKQYGSITIPCKHDTSTWHNEEFFITDTNGPAIIGLTGSKRLQLITLHCHVTETKAGTQKAKINNLKDLKQEYADLFEGIGNFPETLHITLKDNAQPVIQPPRKYPIQLVPEINSELQKMEKLGVITKVNGPTDWVNSLAFSRKSNGKLRICLDPKELNKNIKRTYHKTPTIEELTNKFSGAKFFSKLDARHGYWSVKLDDESSKLTTFNSPKGRYRFTRLPFGLNVSQDVFQKHMDDILDQCPGTTGITDDVVVYGKTEEEHDRNLQHLMEVARKTGLIFNEEKCFIKQRQIKFFGTLFGADGAQPDPDKTEEIRNLPAPKNVTELQQFLGMIQYMSPFIPKLAEHTAPLRALTKKDTKWEWNSSHQAAFNKVKDMICNDTSLAYFDVNAPTTIQVDASRHGLGAALTQNGKAIAFASKALTETEQRYANIERELLAVVFGCERFHTYVYGKNFNVESDHKPLEQIQKKSLDKTPPRLQRMMLRLQRYDMTISYRPGKEMLLADALSRINPTLGPEIDLDKSVFAVQFSTNRLQQLKEETQKDNTLTSLKDVIVNGWPENAKDLPKNLRPYWSMKDQLTTENDLILQGERIIIPNTMKSYILHTIHTGHLGIEKCRLRANTCVYWHGMSRDIETFVKQCITCRTHQNSQPREPLHQHDIPEHPWQTLGTDIMMFDGHDYIIVTDYYSKMPFVHKMTKSGQTTSAHIITYMKQLFGEHGIPEKLISDNGKPYTSHEFKQFTTEWGIQHITSSPRYPQSNGMAERNVQTIKNIMRKSKETHTDINLALLAFRTTPIDNSLPSPAEILYSRKVRTNLPSIMKNHSPHKHHVKTQLQKRQNSQKHYYDKHAHELNKLHPGQPVMMQKEEKGKWTPATVINNTDEPRSYIVQTPNNQTYRRNRRHLIDLQNRTHTKTVRWNDHNIPTTVSQKDAIRGKEDTLNKTPQCLSQADQQADVHVQHRPHRTIRKPDRLIESM